MDAADRDLRDAVIEDLARGAEARHSRGEVLDAIDVALVALVHPETYDISIRLKEGT